MGISGISIWQLLIILVIVVLLFGTKRLGSLGSDLGKMIKGFKSSLNDGDEDKGEKDDKKDEPPKSVEDKNATGEAQSARRENTEHKH